MKRTIGAVTVGRSDWGIYRPVLNAIRQDPELCLRLYVSGTHFSPYFGRTAREIEADGFGVDERIEMSLGADAPESVGKSLGLGVASFAQAFARFQPDILLVLGDRFEMLAAVLAALPFTIPVAHIHGGEATEGAIDDAMRHSISKMSHLHFASTDAYARRLVQMGEDPWRVQVSGAPALDNLSQIQLLSPAELAERIGLPLAPAPLLVTFHPVTQEFGQTGAQVQALLAALAGAEQPVVFTYPNTDTNSHQIVEAIDEFVTSHPAAVGVRHLGTQAYFSLMSHAAAMVGNSSSGIVEAASFGLPVVNVGSRQGGRIRGRNVIDVEPDAGQILAGIRRALSPTFRAQLAGLTNPYGDGQAAQRIVAGLRAAPPAPVLLRKRFYDLPVASPQATAPAAEFPGSSQADEFQVAVR